MTYWFGGPDGAHANADTVHESRECHHLRKADRVYAISYVPETSKVCGVCGSPGNGSDSGGADVDGDDEPEPDDVDDDEDGDDDPEIIADGGRELLGFVIGPYTDAITCCIECAELRGESSSGWPEVRDSRAYGRSVPYPECFDCGEVMRPERNLDVVE